MPALTAYALYFLFRQLSRLSKSLIRGKTVCVVSVVVVASTSSSNVIRVVTIAGVGRRAPPANEPNGRPQQQSPFSSAD